MADDEKDDGGRKFFRIPVDEKSKVTIKIDGANYEVVNVAAGGVGIFLDDVDTFTQGDNITDIVLSIDDVSCKVKGCIAHVSPEDVNYLCGIELIDMDKKTSKLLQRFIDNHKASLFSFMPDF